MTDVLEKMCEAAWDSNEHSTHMAWALASKEHPLWSDSYRKNMRAAIAALAVNISDEMAREMLRYDPVLDRNPQPSQIKSGARAIAAALRSILQNE